MRRAHFAFRPEAGAWTGGHVTYATRMEHGALTVTPAVPESSSPSAAPLTIKVAAIERDGRPLAAPPGSVRVEPEGTLTLERGVVTERLENLDEGVEQSWRFAARPEGKGDLVIRIQFSGETYAGQTASGLHFVDNATGLGLRYGTATWVDGRGTRSSLALAYSGGEATITVPASVVDASSFPAVLDPIVGPELGMDNPVQVAAPNYQMYPAVSFGAGTYLVAWVDWRAGSDEIYGTRVSPSGAVLDESGIPIGAAIGAASTNIRPSMAFDGTNWLVVWTTPDLHVVGALVSPAGELVGVSPLPIETTSSCLRPSVAFGSSEYLVVFDCSSNLYAHRVATTGLVQTPTPISIGAGSYSAIGFNGTNYLVAYGYGLVRARRVGPTGTVIDSTAPILIEDSAVSDSVRPSVASDGTNWIVTYLEHTGPSTTDYSASARRVSGTGTLLDAGPIRLGAISAVVKPNIGAISASYGGGAYTFFWADQTSNIAAARVSPGGVRVAGPLYPITAASEPAGRNQPAAAFDGVNFLLAFKDSRAVQGIRDDIYANRISPTLARLDAPSFVVSQAANEQREACVAFNGTDYLVAWTDRRPQSSTDIYGTRVSRTGSVLDPAGIAISQAIDDQVGPAVASNGTDWFAAWTDSRSGSANLYGTPITGAGIVQDPTGILLSGSGAGHLSLASDGSNYLAVWAGSTLVQGTRVTSQGAVLDTPPKEIGVGWVTPAMPDVAFNGTNYLVVWAEHQHILGVRLSADGTVLDPADIQVGMGVPSDPSVASDGTNWLVAWTERDATMTADIRGARVAANGNVADALGFVISDSTGRQRFPSTAWDGANYWVAWEDPRANQADIYGARVSTAGVVAEPGGIAIASSPQQELAPAIGSGGPREILVVYERFDPSRPSGNNRVRARVVTDLLPAGSPCSANHDCSGDFCVDGFCCDNPCTGPCQACSMAKKGLGPDGVCGAIKAGLDPDDDCAQQPASTCGSNGSCNGAGACQLYPAGIPCGGICSGNSAQGPVCDGSGSCVPGSSVTDCTPYVCSAGTCKSLCTVNGDCVAGYFCAAGACAPASSDGSPCASSAQCHSGSCNDGVCCATACTGLCQACTAAKKGSGVDGACGPIAVSTDPDNECTEQAPASCGSTGTCDGNGACSNYVAGAECGAATCSGTIQTSVRQCDGAGVCQQGVASGCEAGYQCVGVGCASSCADSTACAPGYACDIALGSCVPSLSDAGTESGTGGTGGDGDAAYDGGSGGGDDAAPDSAGGSAGSAGQHDAAGDQEPTGGTGSTGGAASDANSDSAEAGTANDAAPEQDAALSAAAPPNEVGGCGCRVATADDRLPLSLGVLLALGIIRRKRHAGRKR